MNVDRNIYAFDTFVQILNLYNFYNFNVKMLTSLVEVFLLGVFCSELLRSISRNKFMEYNKSYIVWLRRSMDICNIKIVI